MLAGKNSQVFLVSDTFTVPEDVYCIFVTEIGGGGPGSSGYNSTKAGGGLAGGGSAAYCTKIPIDVIPGEVVAITVGNAGIPGFGPGNTYTTSYHVFGQALATNVGYCGIFGGTSRVKSITAEGGQPAFWGISFGHPWGGSGGGNGAPGWELSSIGQGAIAGYVNPGAEGLAILSGKGSNRFYGGSSGGIHDVSVITRDGLHGGAGPGLSSGGGKGTGYQDDGTNAGSGAGGGGASMWGSGGNGGSSETSQTSFVHNALMDGHKPPFNAYGAGGGGGATYDSAYGFGAEGRGGYILVSW